MSDGKINLFGLGNSLVLSQKSLGLLNISLAALVGLVSTVIALKTLSRGVWLDEFVTVAWTTPQTSPREFLHLMIDHDAHPILHYGLIFLAQHAGITSIAKLRFINIFGLPLVISALAYGFRHRAITQPQALVAWMLFATSPLFFDYFAELRCYFLLYSASIAISVIWYVLAKHIEANRRLAFSMLVTWGAYLLIFTNLHYYGTMVGGVLTAALLAQLAVRRSWSQALALAGVSLAVATPALVLGAFQLLSPLKHFVSWIKTTPHESIEMTKRIVKQAATQNFAAVAGALVACLYLLQDRRRWTEFRAPISLLGIIGGFFGAIILANAIHPLLWDRYLIAGAGAITFAVALLATSSGAPVWLPATIAVFALVLQIHLLQSNLLHDRGWVTSARAVAHLQSECATTKVFAYPPLGYPLGPTTNPVSYGYYAKKFQLSYEDLRPGATIMPSGQCPSIIWVEHQRSFFRRHPNGDAETLLKEIGVTTVGTAQLKRYGSGAVIVVQK